MNNQSLVRRLRFTTRRTMQELSLGQYRSAFRGRGMEFEEVREYLPGDDVRAIDWKVTARTGKPQIKVFREERELSVLLLVDQSPSTFSGTKDHLRADCVAEIGSILTFAALQSNDRVGLCSFGGEKRSYLPPKKARNISWQIIKSLTQAVRPRKANPETSFSQTCDFLNLVLKRRSLIFILSDFLIDDLERGISKLTNKHEIIAVRITDPSELALPNLGLIEIEDPETGLRQLLDTSDRAVCQQFYAEQQTLTAKLSKIFLKCKTDTLTINSSRPVGPELVKFFKLRSQHRHHYAG